MGGPTARRIGIVLIVNVELTGLLATPATPLVKKPDLVVKAGSITSQPYAFRDQDQDVVWKTTTKNIGLALARKSKTGFYLYPGPLADLDLGRLNVPALGPGKSSTGKHTSTYAFPSDSWPYGTYFAEFCADDAGRVAEKREFNNCRTAADDFYVVPKTFEGFVQGSIPYPSYPGVTESWGGQVKFQFKEKVGFGTVGVFAWVPFEGTLTYQISGAGSNGCTFSGQAQTTAVSGTVGAAAGNVIQLNFDQSNYYAGAFVGEVMQIPVDEVCQNDTFHHTFVNQGPYLNTGPAPPLPDPLARLTGSYTDSTNTHATWSWDLATFD